MKPSSFSAEALDGFVRNYGHLYIGTKIIQAQPFLKDQIAGYEITYDNGFKSWSPPKAFEDAYQRVDQMSFGQAMEALRMGLCARRAAWSSNKLRLARHPQQILLHVRSEDSEVLEDRFPYVSIQADMLASDWELVLSTRHVARAPDWKMVQQGSSLKW